jgi:hypothetical protein
MKYSKVKDGVFNKHRVRVDDYYKCHAFEGDWDDRELLISQMDLHKGYYRHHKRVLSLILSNNIKNLEDIARLLWCDKRTLDNYLIKNPLIRSELVNLLKEQRKRRKTITSDVVEDTDLL